MYSILPWNDSFAIGHRLLDDEHRRLIELINELCAGLSAAWTSRQLDPILAALSRKAEEHIGSENAILRDIKAAAEGPRVKTLFKPGYVKAVQDAEVDKHIVEHVAMLRRLADITDVSRPRHPMTNPRVCADMKAWFVNHAVTHDGKIKAIFQAA